MAVKNSTILDRIWLENTNDYQQRVPRATQQGVQQVVENLFSPMNGNLYNQFIAGFINLIGRQIIHNKEWENPLAVFKGSKQLYGSVIQESAPRWIKAHTYQDDVEDLLANHRPEFEVWYHSQDRQDKYPITINRAEVMQAFRDEYGLNQLINSILQVPINSDNYDEYRIMMQLIAKYHKQWGFYTDGTALPVDEISAKAFLKQLRAYAGKLKFPSQLYNAAQVGVPTFANMDEMVLLVTPDALASIDVDALAAAFNMERADIQYRTVVVDEFPVPDMYALLTTDAFFVCHDTVYETRSFADPNTLNDNYFLHHWGIYSCSPFVPAIAFISGAENTTIPTVTQEITSLQMAFDHNTIDPGGAVQITTTLNGTLDPDSHHGIVEIAPDSATFEITATRTTGEDDEAVTSAVALNSRTYVDRLGVLHLQRGKVEVGDVITVTATSTYTNPSGETETYTATETLTVA